MKGLKNNIIFRYIWKKIRLSRILKEHKQTANLVSPYIKAYFDEEMQEYPLIPKKDLSIYSHKIIWQYWGQGLTDLPEIIEICFKSVDYYKGDYVVIRLSDKTVTDYIDIPEHIKLRVEQGQMTKTFFSDWLRLALLITYGGLWLDATTYLSGPIMDFDKNSEFFMFQRSNKEQHKMMWENIYAYYWNWSSSFKVKCLNSIIWGKKGCKLLVALYEILTKWWEGNDSLPNYFFFQILFNEIIKQKPTMNCPIVSDCIPHRLQMKINHPHLNLSFEETFKLTSIHKMTYFSEEKLEELKNILADYAHE